MDDGNSENFDTLVESHCFGAEGGTGNLDEAEPSGRRWEKRLIKYNV